MLFNQRRGGREAIGLCGNCTAACCRDMIMPLTDKEAAWLTEAGSNISAAPKERFCGVVPPRNREFYIMTGACAMLDQETNLCMTPDNPNRPRVCDELKSGSDRCLEIRFDRLPSSNGYPVPMTMPQTRRVA